MPNRTRRFTQSLLTGYGKIGVNIVVSLLSVPLALAYLGKEEFGLWALALQINGYLNLIDMGMSGAVGRFLADHKDDVESHGYTEHLSTGACVFLIQALIVTSLGMVLAHYAPALLSIQAHLADEFTFILRCLCVISGISIISRTFGSPLWAFQRMDVVNVAALIGLVVGFFIMWLGFHLGYGVRSFAAAAAIQTLIAATAYILVCARRSYYPKRKNWFSPRWSIFREMFAFGRDGMLLTIGSQLVNATQITIISRTLGLNAAASFAIATKLYGLSTMLFHKVVESAAPGLTEMFARGQREPFIRRYWDIIAITLATASVGAVALAAGNSAFISLWTGGKVTWSVSGDLLLGLMVIAISTSRCFMTLFGVTKNLKPVRAIYFIEGIIFVPLAIFAARRYGVEGVLVASLAAHLLVAFSSSLRAASKVLGSCRRLAIPLVLSISMTGMGTLLAIMTENQSLLLRISTASIPVVITGLMAWKFVIPFGMRALIQSKIAHVCLSILPRLSNR